MFFLEDKIEKFQDLMLKLFDFLIESKSVQIVVVILKDLKDFYKNYMDVMNIVYNLGYIERVINSS